LYLAADERYSQKMTRRMKGAKTEMAGNHIINDGSCLVSLNLKAFIPEWPLIERLPLINLAHKRPLIYAILRS